MTDYHSPLFRTLLLACCLGLSPASLAQGLPEYELPPVEYSSRPASNPLTRFNAALDRQEPELTGDAWLPWLLAETGVPVSSQVLVFSRTSLQRDRIHPRRPRALYFNDDLYLGWVPGGLVEAAVTDPELGLVFYHFDTARQGRRRFERDANCLSCHGGSMTRNQPGLLVRSVFPDERGEPITAAGTFLVGHDTPLEQRWGGWYVTGHHGDLRHLGNALARPGGPQGAILDRDAGANLTSLDAFFPTRDYPRPDSDIVPLLVLEHQVHVHNYLVHGALRVRRWNHYQRQLQLDLGEPASSTPVGTALRVIQSETERILTALLFKDEAPLPQGGVSGAGDFERDFSRNRRPDPAQRSLKDFDLQTRLFRYRCSYLVYSDGFASLPDDLRQSVLRRLQHILTATEPPRGFEYLPAEERTAIHDILTATLPEYAALP